MNEEKKKQKKHQIQSKINSFLLHHNSKHCYAALSAVS